MKSPNFFKSVFFGIPIGITIFDSFGYVARVDGISMQPALNPDKNQTDYVFLNRWAVKSYEIRRGDIISLISPKDPGQKIIKRVVGVEGDLIATLGYKKEIVRVPEGHCWIEGDHTGHSMDSNNFGPVSIGLVTAKASCIVWPPSRWQLIRSFLPDSRVPLNLVSKSIIDKMRAISLVKRIEFEFAGNVVRNALTLGDVDNDGCNELVVGNQNGDVVIFKGNEKYQEISKLPFVSCVAVGDVLNENRNVLVIVTANGWCYIYAVPEQRHEKSEDGGIESVEQVDGQTQSTSTSESVETLPKSEPAKNIKSNKKDDADKVKLVCIHKQRIPANAKNILLGDVDGDGVMEMVLGLTDRVVRSYRWMSTHHKAPVNISDSNLDFESSDKLLGKFVALNKWECANQIGSITLHHSWDGKASLLIAQPGGTFMRIKCSTDDIVCQESIENSTQSNSSGSQGENIPGSVDYQFLGISRMRNQNISTEILGDLKCSYCDSKNSSLDSSMQKSELSKNATKGRPYAVATLDGTIMLVQDEVILWAIAVDHQVFALTKLDVTGNGSDDIVVCSWDGQTYILDQEKNSVRFHLDEPVQAFTSGYYNVRPNEPAVTCLVYVTFKNTIIVYYDIPLRDLICKRFEPDMERLSELFMEEGRKAEVAVDIVRNLDRKTKRDLVEFLLYNVNS